MSVHLDLDALADLLAGEGTAAEVDHVAACLHCSGALVELEEAQQSARTALARLPEPQVPPEVAARLAAALAAAGPPARPGAPPGTGGPVAPDERDERDDAGGPGEPRPEPVLAPVRSLPERGAAPRAGRLLRAAAAAAAVLALGTGALLVAQRSSPAGTSATGGRSAAEAPSSAAGEAAPQSAPGTDGLGSALLHRTGTDYAEPGALERELPRLLRGPVPPDAARGAPSETSSPGDPLARLRTPAALAECVQALGAPAPDAVDHGTYAGRPAVLVLLPAPRPDQVESYVVGAGCRRDDPQVLARRTVPRP